jgi:hypothetical protein
MGRRPRFRITRDKITVCCTDNESDCFELEWSGQAPEIEPTDGEDASGGGSVDPAPGPRPEPLKIPPDIGRGDGPYANFRVVHASQFPDACRS